MGTFTQNSLFCDMGHHHDSSFTERGLTENCHNVSSLLACMEKTKHFMHFQIYISAYYPSENQELVADSHRTYFEKNEFCQIRRGPHWVKWDRAQSI